MYECNALNESTVLIYTPLYKCDIKRASPIETCPIPLHSTKCQQKDLLHIKNFTLHITREKKNHYLMWISNSLTEKESHETTNSAHWT